MKRDRTGGLPGAIAVALGGVILTCSGARALGEAETPAPERVLTAVLGTGISYDAKPPQEDIDSAMRDLQPYFDLLWVGPDTWQNDILNLPGELERTQRIMDGAHAHGLKVAFVLNWATLLPGEEVGEEESLFGRVLDPTTGLPKVQRAWDYGSREALKDFRQRCRRLYAAIGRKAEMFVADEQIMADPGQNFWFEPVSTYWTSPTYSRAALQDFRAFLAREGVAGARDARFPVTTKKVEPGSSANEGLPAVAITDENRQMLVADDDWPQSDLWRAWYRWRCELYARWLGAACEEAARQWGGQQGWVGCSYTTPRFWTVPALGQDLDLIAAIPSLDYLCAGYMSGTHFEQFRDAALRAGKKWGAVVETCHYGVREGTDPKAIRDTLLAAVKGGASLIHVYAGENFRTDRREPSDNGLYYMPEQVKAWAKCVDWLRARQPAN